MIENIICETLETVISAIKSCGKFHIGEYFDNRFAEFYEIPHGDNFIIVKLYHDHAGAYYSYVDYQIHDSNYQRNDIWKTSSAKKFYIDFCHKLKEVES